LEGRVPELGHIEVEDLATVSVVRLVGEHDISTAPALEATLDPILDGGRNIVLDLSRASFIDSTILRATILGHRALTPARIVAVAAPRGTEPRRLIELVELTAIIPVFDSLGDAVVGTNSPLA
jgi:anti-sigma B factor antagonist